MTASTLTGGLAKSSCAMRAGQGFRDGFCLVAMLLLATPAPAQDPAPPATADEGAPPADDQQPPTSDNAPTTETPEKFGNPINPKTPVVVLADVLAKLTRIGEGVELAMTSASRSDDPLVGRAQDAMQRNFSHLVSVEALATEIGVSHR